MISNLENVEVMILAFEYHNKESREHMFPGYDSNYSPIAIFEEGCSCLRRARAEVKVRQLKELQKNGIWDRLFEPREV